MDYQTQIDNLIELAIVQRDELKQLVEQLPQLRDYLSAEVEKKFEAVEPELRSELEAFFAQKTDERVEDLRGEVSERIAEVLKSLEMAASAKYAALMQEKDRAAEVLNQAEAKIAEVQAAIPGKVKELVTDELSRFPRANQIDQLRKEFAEPRGLNPRGKWQAGQRYQKLDLVSYNGESYVSNVDDNTEKPSRSSAAWTLSAARGQGGGGGGITSLNDLIGSPTSDLDIVGAEGSNYVRKTLTAGANVTLTETPTEITISSTGGGGGTSAETLIANVTNAESVAITKGQVVYAFAATGNRVSVKLAYNTSDATSAKTFGVVSSASISAGGTGTVTCVGVIDGLNLGTFVDGDSVYLGATPGTFTATKPYAPNHLVYVGIVERANAGNGELYVRIQNGYELDEIHDVQITAPKLAGQTLLYDATTDLWKNARLTGTANQITVTNADAAVTLSIPNNPIFKGTTSVATTGGVATHVLEYTGGNSLFTGYNATNSVFAQNGGASMTLSNSVAIAAAGSNQPITLTPSGAATAGGLSLSRLTSTNQTLALLNYGTDELMSIAGTGYTGVGSRSNTGFLLYSNNTERARFLAGGNFLIAKTIDNALGRLQVNGAITMEETAGTGLFGFFGGSSLVYGSLASNPVVIRTNNTAALTLDTSQNATFAKDILLGTSGPSVPGTLSGRAPRQGLVSDGTGLITATSTNIGTGDFTASAWVNAASYVASVFGFNGAGGIVNCVLDFPSDTLMRVYDGAGPTAYTVTVPTRPVNKWFHATWVRSAGVVTCYLDGVSQGTVTANFDIGAINYIGSISAFNKFTGRLSGLYLYNRALSAAEVKALYETGVPAASDINSASNTSLLTGANSDFSSAGNWVPNPPANISGGKLNLLNTHATNTGVTLLAGKRYRLACTIDSITAGNFAVYNGSAYLNITGTAGAVSYEFNVAVTTVLFVRCTGGDAVVDNMFLYPVGAVLAPDAAQTGGGLTWYDTSGNGANIALPASGVSWNVPTSGYITSSGQLNLFSGGTSNINIAPTGAGQVIIANNTGAGTATRLTIAQTGVRLFYIENTATTGNLTFGDGAGEYLRLIGSGAGTFLFGTTTNSNNGRIQLATHTSTAGGIGFGTDISLSRSAGDSLDFTVSTGAPTLRFMNGAVYRGYVGTNGPVTVLNSQAGGIQLQTNATVALTLDTSQNATFAGNINALAGKSLNFTGTATALSSFVNMYVTSLAGGDATGGRMTWYSSGTGNVETGFLQVTQASGFGGTFSIGLNTTNSGTASTVFQIKKNGNTLLGTTTDSSNGRLQLADHTAAAGGIGFGTDVTLYRSAADVLRTDDRFQAESTSGTNAAAGILGVLNTSGAGVTNSFGVDARILVNNSSGSTTSAIGLRSLARVSNASTVSGLYSMYAQVDNPGSGTISFAFGLYVAPITVGATNYAIWTEGATSSRFGGNVIIEKPIADNCGVSVINSNSSGLPGLYLEGDAGNYALIRRNNSALANPNRLEYIATGTGANHYFNTNVTIAGNLTVTGTISPSSGAGLTNVWIPASQWIPRTTNGCGVDSTETTTNRQNFDELLFDPAAIEYAQALVRMPSNYNNGTVTARFFWSSSSSTGSVVWGLQARAFADDDALDTAFGTAQTVTDTLLATGDMHISAATSAVTSGGTPAATTPLQIQIYRDATNGSDTLGSDARLLGVEISFTSV